MELCDDMILWCSLQLPLLADWKNLARRLGVQSVIPIVRDVIESSEKVSTALVVLQKVASELHPKVRNHGEGPY